MHRFWNAIVRKTGSRRDNVVFVPIFFVAVIDCGPVPRIGNATVVEQRVSEMYGAQVTHRCPLGYGRNGGADNTIVTTCQPDQTWSDVTSACLSESSQTLYHCCLCNVAWCCSSQVSAPEHVGGCGCEHVFTSREHGSAVSMRGGLLLSRSRGKPCHTLLQRRRVATGAGAVCKRCRNAAQVNSVYMYFTFLMQTSIIQTRGTRPSRRTCLRPKHRQRASPSSRS